MAQAYMTEEMRACIEECMNCHRICAETLRHCLDMGGRHVEPRHVRLLLDCQAICALAADFMLGGSQFHERTCGVCATICAACADSCAEIAPHDPAMQLCAEVCRACASTCRGMAGMIA